MSKKFDPVKYKEDLKKDWSEKAHIYHEHYAAPRAGPFKSVEKLVETAKLHEGDRVLDVATGTGIVTMEALKKIGKSGKVVGIDISSGPLAIAKKEISNLGNNIEFLEMDAEDLKFPDQSFDVVLSQFALFFFPDTQKALREIKRVLVKDGRIAISVHGSEENVPYFSISTSIQRYIPDIRPAGTPTPYRFGKAEVLKAELEKCDLKNIDIRSYTYTYNVGTFDDYWNEFMRSTANAIRSRLESLDPVILDKIRNESKERVEKFLKNNKLEFPWQVLIASATT